MAMLCNTGDTWINWAGNVTVEPFRHCFPQSIDDLIALVQEAESLGRHVRASGSHWSFSDVAITQDYLIETQQLNKTLDNVVPNALTDDAKSRRLYHVEAGITLHELYTRLDQHQPAKRALPTLGGSGGQTLAGAISTATHGGDFNLPPLADAVQAIHLVGPQGTQYWIERKTPITDPQKLSDALPHLDPGKIIYDDDWFYAVLVSMGCMGIIYSLVLEVREQFGLSELRAQSSWNVVRPLLENGSLFTTLPPWVKRTGVSQGPFTPRFLEIVMNPHQEEQGDHTCMVSLREEITIPDPPTGRPSKSFFTALCERSSLSVHDLVDPLLLTLNATGGAMLTPWLAPALTALYSLDITVSGLIATIVNLAEKVRLSWLVRDLTNSILTLGRPAETDRTDVSYAIMDGYDYSAPPVNCYKVLSLEIILDATNNHYLNFIEDLFQIVDDAVNQGIYLAGLFAIRFSGRSNAYLTMQQEERTCAIEISPLTDADSTVELLKRFEDAIIPYGGRAHWGQIHQRCYTDTYRNFARWLAIRAVITNNGTIHTFDNDFSLRCGF
jgi:hypothetical protein